jgi:hypothetical protein
MMRRSGSRRFIILCSRCSSERMGANGEVGNSRSKTPSSREIAKNLKSTRAEVTVKYSTPIKSRGENTRTGGARRGMGLTAGRERRRVNPAGMRTTMWVWRWRQREREHNGWTDPLATMGDACRGADVRILADTVNSQVTIDSLQFVQLMVLYNTRLAFVPEMLGNYEKT